MIGYPKLRTSRRRDQKIADFMQRYGHNGVMRWEDILLDYDSQTFAFDTVLSIICVYDYQGNPTEMSVSRFLMFFSSSHNIF